MEEPTPFLESIERPMGLKFSDMTGRQQVVFVTKVVACVATFGFAFPNVQSD